MNDSDRKLVLESLAQSRDTMLAALRSEAGERSDEGWTPLQIGEHIAVCEEAILGLVRDIIAVRPPDPALRAKVQWSDQDMVSTVSYPKNKAISPDSMLPTGRFKTIDEAANAFAQARTLTIEFASTTEVDLRERVFPHPALGPMDGVQWLLFQAAHSTRHANQIQVKKP